jgi:hypothetical protein
VKTSNSAPHHEKARTYPLGHALKSMCGVMHLKGGPQTQCSARLESRRRSSVLCDFAEPTLVLQPAVLWAILLIR